MRSSLHMKILLLCSLSLASPLIGACQKAQTDSPRTQPQALEQPSQALIILDKRINAQEEPELIAGRLQEVKPGTDAPRVIVLEQVPKDLGLAPGQRVLDAQFVEDGAVVLGDDQVLMHYSGGHTRQLDVEVLGPLSVASNKVAYVRGLPPDLSLATVELDEGEPKLHAPALTTVWSPALSEDGKALIFAATYEGRARLFRLAIGDEPKLLRKGGPMPSSPVAPQWRHDHLVFEHEQGVVLLDLRQDQATQEYLEAKLMPDDGSGQVKIWDGEQARVILQPMQERR